MPRISRVFHPVTALGPGSRLGIWFQGCSLACQGCLARDTWSRDGGADITIERLLELWVDAMGKGATGLTISGGEPADQPDALVDLLRAVQSLQMPTGSGETDVLVYTGYEIEGFAERAAGALSMIDAVISGPYDIRRPTDLVWRGSRNQVLHILSALGMERYEKYSNYVPERPSMQVLVDDRDIWYVGVPRRGDLSRIERALRLQGFKAEAASWRP